MRSSFPNRSLTPLLHPKSIAFIGGMECDVAISRTLELGFTGKIWAVHPKRDRLGGIATLRSVEHIDGPVDAAFIAVRREPTIDIVRILRAKGCGGAVIYASGFAETGDGDLQAELLAAANGMPLMGPNCYGFVNGLARVALWPDQHGIEPCEAGVAIVTQSGNLACNFTMTRRALPVAAVFAIGNQADIDMGAMLQALAQDDRVTAIGLHIEGLPDIRAFATAAELSRQRRKPVVALKTGRSEHGAKLALTHTSSLAGADQLYDALFERHGIARLDTVTAFAETLKFLHHGGPLRGNRLVSMSCSGGEAALVADMALKRDLEFPRFDPVTKAKVGATLNDYVPVDNPLDYHTFIWGQEDKLAATFTAVLSGGFDLVVLLLDIPTNPRMDPAAWLATARALMTAAKATEAHAAVVATLPECMPLTLAGELSRHGIVPMMGLDDALSAFDAAARIGRNWARHEPAPEMLAAQDADGPVRTLTEFEAKQLLTTFGLHVPEGQLCEAASAAAAAESLGFPVTLKISSRDITHKTELGGIALNLRTPEDVTGAARRLSEISDELLIEKMVTGAVAELIVGIKSDPQFGLALVIGAGGVLAELLKDTAALLLPTSRSEVERALKTLKVWKLVEGFREKSGDSHAVIEAIESIAAFAEAHRGRIEALDVNPLLVLADDAIAVDALIRMRTP